MAPGVSMQYQRLSFCALLLSISCCVGLPHTETTFSPVQSSRSVASFQATGISGAIATSHPLASQAAIEVLKEGGNANDAAIAASFVISVVRPQSTGIGGGGFLISHDQRSGQNRVFDFRERAPQTAKRDMYLDENKNPKGQLYLGKLIPNASMNGHLSAGVPGIVKGLHAVHQSGGRLPWKRLVRPAIDIARLGFPVYEGLAEAILERRDILQHFASSRALLFPGGQPLKTGDILRQPELAWTLEQIAANGADGFYKGKVAEHIVNEMKHGILSAEDLQRYSVKERRPVQGTFRGYSIVSMPPPSSGGVHIIQMLNMLEGDALEARPRHDPANVHLISEVMRRAFADRAELLGDSDFVKVPVAGLLSKKYAAQQRGTISLEKSTASANIGKSLAPGHESSSTTHISVVDRDGNAVSTTQTVNYTFGSCVLIPGAGFFMNDEMDDFSIKPGVPNAFGLIGGDANSIVAGKTMLSSMSPTIVLDKSGKVALVVGSPGGPRIISATFQTILNFLAFRMPIDQAVHTFRIHHQWMPDILKVEKNALTEKALLELTAKGHKTEVIERIGDVQAIARTSDGWTAVSDTRSEGKPLAY